MMSLRHVKLGALLLCTLVCMNIQAHPTAPTGTSKHNDTLPTPPSEIPLNAGYKTTKVNSANTSKRYMSPPGNPNLPKGVGGAGKGHTSGEEERKPDSAEGLTKRANDSLRKDVWKRGDVPNIEGERNSSSSTENNPMPEHHDASGPKLSGEKLDMLKPTMAVEPAGIAGYW